MTDGASPSSDAQDLTFVRRRARAGSNIVGSETAEGTKPSKGRMSSHYLERGSAHDACRMRCLRDGGTAQRSEKCFFLLTRRLRLEAARGGSSRRAIVRWGPRRGTPPAGRSSRRCTAPTLSPEVYEAVIKPCRADSWCGVTSSTRRRGYNTSQNTGDLTASNTAGADTSTVKTSTLP